MSNKSNLIAAALLTIFILGITASVFVFKNSSTPNASTIDNTKVEQKTTLKASEVEPKPSVQETNDPIDSPQGVKSMMPIYVEPYYNSDPFRLEAGEYSKDLLEANSNNILEVAEKLKKKWSTLPVTTMYITAVRLYDLGKKDESVYWFHHARCRQRFFKAILDESKIGGIGSPAFELSSAHHAFPTLAGVYINGYAFGDTKKLLETLNRVKSECQALPEFKKIYPNVVFIHELLWQEKNKEVIEGFDTLVDWIKANPEKIKEERKKKGIEGKY